MSTSPPTTFSGLARFHRPLRSLLGLLVALTTLIPIAALADPRPGANDPEAATVTGTSVAPAAMANTAVSQEPDGLSESTAAASCWEIVQHDPSAEDGVYWLVTPELGAPQQFYCDQTTDGGGWVLIGRGREYWTQSNEGRLTPADVAQTPTGTGAFSPAQLSAGTVNGLLNDGRVDDLAEGVRLRRARAIDGSAWQEVRFQYGTPRDDWSWQFAGVQNVSFWSMDSSTGSSGDTGNFGADSSYRRVDANVDGNRGWARGFSYGRSARGDSSSTSYVWAPSSTAGYPRPFTQVFLRPQLMSGEIFTSIPNDGLPQSTNVATAQSYPMPTPWGVSGLGAGGGGELNTEVADFAESNGVMYVGGNFRYVQRDGNGAGRVEQSYLAAFDVATGEWISSFRPNLNNQVKALAVLPDGRIAVGGAFSTVDDNSSPAFTVVDPVTGASDPAVTTRIINYTGGVPPIIRSMDVQDGFVYLGGRFTHLTGSGVTSEVYQRNIGRLDASTLAPRPGWDPMLDGTVVSVDASEQGDQIYAAGYFGLSRWTEETIRAGAFTASDATVIPWSVDFSNTSGGRTGYQQAVKEVGDRVWLGGAEHMLFSYDRSTMQELSTNITQGGGDFQAINPYGEDGVAAGCHCSENVYQGARTWPQISGFSRVEHIDQVGIWRASDGDFVPEHSPQVSLRSGYGAWAIQEASDGSLWVGGDYTHARMPNTLNQWTGAFVRFAATDTAAPDTPQGLNAASAEGTDQLSWNEVADATYEVLREDRVVATTASTSLQLPSVQDGARYFVRAVDQTGNRSATTRVVVPEVVDPGTLPVTAIAAGEIWDYRYETDAPDDEWKDADFDDSSWESGTAPLGWGHNDLGTELTADGTRPLTSYFRRKFDVDDSTQIEALTLTTRADDGIVVYVNGTEVGRANMPEGTIGHSTYATSAPSAANAVANPVTLTVPGNLLVTGENVITTEVHLNYRTTPSISFELEAVLTPGEQPAPDPDPEPDPEPEPDPLLLVPAGSDWTHRYETDAPDDEWKDADFDDSSWESGTAPLGWGHNDLGTELTADGTRPLTSYFRRKFDVDDSTQIEALTLTTRADDGIVVYVNGTEVGRANMPEGTIGHSTYATSAPSAANAVANPVTLTVPGNLLVTGENVITTEVHLNYRTTPSISFELEATIVQGEQAGDPLQAVVNGTEAPADTPEGAGTEPPADEPESSAPDASEPGEQELEETESMESGPAKPEPAPSNSDSSEGSPPEPEDGESASSTPVEDLQKPSSACLPTPAEEDDVVDNPAELDAGIEVEEEPVDPDEVIPLGSEWAFDCGTEAVADWISPDLDDSEWQRGAAPLGWGGKEQMLNTVLRTGDATPHTARYRHTFELDDLDDVQSLSVTLPADDAFVVHVNGVEVGRENLPDGELDPSVRAIVSPDSATVAEQSETLTVPVGLLVIGENAITIEIRTGESPDSDSTFDAHGVLVRDSV